MDIKTLFESQRNVHAFQNAQNRSNEKPETSPAEAQFDAVFEKLNDVENLSVETLLNDGDAQTLVHSLVETELAVETAVKIRDKLVEAYQEILRMPV